MKHLSKAEFLSTFASPMQKVPLEAKPPCDFWNYFEKIPIYDFNGHDCSAGFVDQAWNDASKRYQHILVNSTDKNVFMVIVIDLEQNAVFGHRMLDLNYEYGLATA